MTTNNFTIIHPPFFPIEDDEIEVTVGDVILALTNIDQTASPASVLAVWHLLSIAYDLGYEDGTEVDPDNPFAGTPDVLGAFSELRDAA